MSEESSVLQVDVFSLLIYVIKWCYLFLIFCVSFYSVQRIHTWPVLIVWTAGLHRQNLSLIPTGKGVLFRQLQDVLLTGFGFPGCQPARWHLPWLKDNLLIRGSVLFGRFWHGQQVRYLCMCRASSTQAARFTLLTALWGWANGLSTLWQPLGCLRPHGVQILGRSLHSCTCRPPLAAATRAPGSFCAPPWSHRHEKWKEPLTVQRKIFCSFGQWFYTKNLLSNSGVLGLPRALLSEKCSVSFEDSKGG